MESPDGAADSGTERAVEKTAAKQDFLLFLANIAPKSLTELTDRLAELLAAVAEHQKAGTLTYKIKIKPAPKLDDMVLVDDDVTVSLPEAERGSVGVFYVVDNQLADRPAAQGQLFEAERRGGQR